MSVNGESFTQIEISRHIVYQTLSYRTDWRHFFFLNRHEPLPTESAAATAIAQMV